LTAAVCDAVGLGCAGFVANLSYMLFSIGEFKPFAGSPAIGLVDALIFCLLAGAQGLYRIQSLLSSGGRLSNVVANYAVSLLALTLGLFMLKIGADYSRGGVVLFAVFGLGVVIAVRKILCVTIQRAAKRGAIQGRPVVAIGEFSEMAQLSELDLLQFGLEAVERVALTPRKRGAGLAETAQIQLAQAIEAARRLHAQEFALLIPWNRDQALAEILSRLRASPLPVRLYPDHRLRNILVRETNAAVDSDFSALLQRAPLNRRKRGVKRGLDLAVSSFLLLFLSPLLLTTALLIKLDSPGPILFRQRRGGFDNREFFVFKFRTMSVREGGGAVRQAGRNDRRVTRIGRVLRRTSIDALPQLLNVLKGEMSLVGPRPHDVARDAERRTQIGNCAMRRHVKPGLTGAAQVAGLRGETRALRKMERRVELDLWYIDNWSLALDLRVLAQTFVALLEHQSH
jgi:undecaprenyl-phosphate galactose phosphotransferase/putative colanic acid biosynthesis UDP-glucose lipid carrier transferase